MSVTLFANHNLAVRRVDAGGDGPIVVTFDSYHDVLTLERSGFGEAFFAGIGITAIHVLCRDNVWFQYPEMPQVLSEIRTAVAGARTVMTYGSSMGAYAAIRFADAVGAHAALALSPQYSIDRAKTPFEKRWGHARRSVRFLPSLDGPIRCGCAPVVIYDDKNIDRRHVDLIAADTPIVRVRAPFGGHPISTYLSEIDALKSIVREVLDHRFDATKLEAQLRRGRRESASYVAGLCERQPAWRPRLTASLAHRVLSMAHSRSDLQNRMALKLAALGHFEEAIAAHRRADELELEAVFLLSHSRTLHAAGQLGPALVLADRLVDLYPNAPDYHDWRSKSREATDDLRGAADSARVALALDPTNIRYIARAAQLEWKLTHRRGVNLLGRLIDGRDGSSA